MLLLGTYLGIFVDDLLSIPYDTHSRMGFKIQQQPNKNNKKI